MKPFYTVGYEGITIDVFISILRNHNIERIIDVRKNPISRKQGFSKNALSKALEENGILYTHIPELGTPKEYRDNLKEDDDYDSFFEKVEYHIKRQENALQAALDLSLSQNCALLCFEKNPQECHRHIVAAELVRLSSLQLDLEHILL